MSRAYSVVPIGTVRSTLSRREQAPRQGREGAPDAWLELEPAYREGARDVRAGEEILVLTWLDRADRSVLAVHPRGDESAPLTGVFSTRSPDRPNPIGIHRVRILEITDGRRLRVSDLEALDRTPIVDLKPVLDPKEITPAFGPGAVAVHDSLAGAAADAAVPARSSRAPSRVATRAKSAPAAKAT
jgi:tRNA-Thr(GGU) m(6)t(6)A37 methyltransferase TsaA